MLLYKYPDKDSRLKNKINAVKEYQERKKIKRNLFINILISAVVLTLTILSNNILAIIIVSAVIILLISNSLFIYMNVLPKNSKFIVTEIYDNKIRNVQYGLFSINMYMYEFEYVTIIKSYQSLMGELCFELNKPVAIKKISSDGRILPYKKISKKVTLKFLEAHTKYFLINNCKEKIQYEGYVKN